MGTRTDKASPMGVRVGLVLALLAASVSMGSFWADAGEKKPDRTEQSSGSALAAEVETQRPLAEASERLMGFEDAARFGSVRIDNEDSRVILYWRGDWGASVQAAVDEIRAGGVEASVERINWSLADLTAESRRLASLDPRKTGVRITGAGPSANMTGIEVRVRPADLSRAPNRITSNYPVTFVGGPEFTDLYNRWDDTQPFWGGAMMDSHLGFGVHTYCSSSFAVTLTTGTEAIITANHCGVRSWATPIGNRHMGVSVGGDPATDSTYVSGETYDPVVYTSIGYQGSSHKDVIGSGNPANGAMLLASGAASGSETVEVVSINQFIVVGGTVRGPGFFTEDPHGDFSIGSGDSGGPTVREVDSTSVRARGMISAGDNNFQGTPCQGATQFTRTCYSRVFHVNINDILTGLGVQIVVNPPPGQGD